MTTDRVCMAGAAFAILGAVGCSDSAAPAPAPVAIPAFVYVADSAGYSNLVRWRNDTVTTLTTGARNSGPNSAGTRIVFTSERTGRPHVYIADLDLVTQHQVTSGNSFNQSAALSPSGDSIVFVSTRSGTPRIWVVNAPALNQVGIDAPVAIATGSPTYTPEDGPAWNPLGGTIAFTSVRSGVSQLYVVASGGGTPTQLTNETGGAFQPTWTPDGTRLYYLAAVPNIVLRRVNVNGSGATTIAGDSLSVGGPASCGLTVCLFAEDPSGARGFMLGAPLSGAPVQRVFARTAAMERQPAVLP